MYDKMEKIGSSLIQHGKLSDRVYVMKAAPEDFPGLLDRIDELCENNDYSKVVAKAPECLTSTFRGVGYSREAQIPGYYSGDESASFWTHYPNPGRAERADSEQVKKTLRLAAERAVTSYVPDTSIKVERATVAELDEMAEVYSKVFPTYPFPITDPDYLRQTMETHVKYFLVRGENGRIAALASAELDPENLAAEMTDFATLPEARGAGFARALLHAMELHITDEGYLTAFTIARAYSAGMNITFACLGYDYSGTLVNNTNIGGQIESMNIWWKRLGN